MLLPSVIAQPSLQSTAAAAALCPAELPMHLPQLIPAISHYHWVLKTCHSGAELDTALTCAQGFVDPDLRCGKCMFKTCYMSLLSPSSGCYSGAELDTGSHVQGFVDPDLRCGKVHVMSVVLAVTLTLSCVQHSAQMRAGLCVLLRQVWQ
jgi:hypothetical protein